MKARFETQVPAVTVYPEDGNNVCIQIALNEQPFSETDAEGNVFEGFEYTFHEFHIDRDEIDLDDVNEFPEDYLDYPLPIPTLEERVAALEAVQLENMEG